MNMAAGDSKIQLIMTKRVSLCVKCAGSVERANIMSTTLFGLYTKCMHVSLWSCCPSVSFSNASMCGVHLDLRTLPLG